MIFQITTLSDLDVLYFYINSDFLFIYLGEIFGGGGGGKDFLRNCYSLNLLDILD